MSVEYDIVAGFDCSSLASVTQAQLMQMINQAAPVSNKGLSILQPGTGLGASYAAGTNGSPDVASNPRFANYIWLNSYNAAAAAPTPYLYNPADGKWYIQTVAAGAISSTELAAHVSALTHMFTAAGVDATLADKVLVYDSSGQYVTQITKAALIGSLSVTLSQISTSGAAVNQVIKNVSGATTWANINLSTDPLDGTLPLNKIATSTNGFILQMVGGVPAWISNDDSVSGFLPAGTTLIGVAVSKLKIPGTALAYPRTTAAGTGWETLTVPIVQRVFTKSSTTDSTGTNIPLDDTLPVPGAEGKNYAALDTTLTPKSATTTLRVRATLNLSRSAAGTVIGYIARDGVTIGATTGQVSTTGSYVQVVIEFDTPSTAANATTFKVYFGSNAGTAYLNAEGGGGTRLFGGVSYSSIEILEVQTGL